jgi:hypothetical protein
VHVHDVTDRGDFKMSALCVDRRCWIQVDHRWEHLKAILQALVDAGMRGIYRVTDLEIAWMVKEPSLAARYLQERGDTPATST